MAFNPVTGRILFVDSEILYEIGEKIRILIGQPPFCDFLETLSNQTVRPTFAQFVRSVAVSEIGDVFIAETDEKKLNQIRKFSTGEKVLKLVAGVGSNCDCDPKHCPCDDAGPVLGPEGHLHSPVSIAIGPDGKIYVADLGNNRLKILKFGLPELKMRTYEVRNPVRNEIFLFNRFGHHIHTIDSLTGRYLYNFSYDPDTSYGKLTQITGSGGHKFYINRRNPQIVSVENVNGQKTQLHFNYDQRLVKLEYPDGSDVRMAYNSESGLLKSILDSEKKVNFFDYDSSGRLMRISKSEKFAKFEKQFAGNSIFISELGEISENRLLKIPMEINFSSGISMNLKNFSLQFNQNLVMLRKMVIQPLGSEKVEWRTVKQANGKQKRVAQVSWLFFQVENNQFFRYFCYF